MATVSRKAPPPEGSGAKATWQKIAQGLFGPQGAYREEERHFTVRPIGRVLADLLTIPADGWARYAFSREPLNGKFTDEQRIDLAAKARDCGRVAALQCAEQYDTRDPAAIGEAMGLVIDYPMRPQGGERVLFAEFREPKTVHVYRDGVYKAERLMTRVGVREALTPTLDITKLLLAHELFHVWEEAHADIFTRTYRFTLWTLGPVRNRSGLAVLSEIAAMAFCAELTQLPYSPYLMDVFLVYGYAPERACGLYEEMMTYAADPNPTADSAPELGDAGAPDPDTTTHQPPLDKEEPS